MDLWITKEGEVMRHCCENVPCVCEKLAEIGIGMMRIMFGKEGLEISHVH